MKLKFLIAACVAATAMVAAQAQQPAPEPQAPTFRVEVNYVEVDASVTDAQGNPVTDLTIDDFEVLEDGRPQKITAFSQVNLPIARADQPLFTAGPIEPDVQSNASVDGRIYLIVLDDLHTTFSNSVRTKAAVKQFIDRNLGANDLAAVVYTSGRANVSQDFTNSKRLLTAAVDNFMGRNLPSATAERFAGNGSQCGAVRSLTDDSSTSMRRANDPCEMERAFQARTALQNIRRLADFMAGVRGRRKAMLFFSEGISYDTHDPFANRSASVVLDETRDAIAAATRANVVIYAVDPRGLAGVGGDADIGMQADDLQPGDIPTAGLLSELRLSQDSLRVLADETGGFAAINRNDFTDAYTRIVRENSSYYLLGYYPSNDRRDGRFRRIEVRLKRPGLQVRSRRGYAAPRGRAPNTDRPRGDNAAQIAAIEAINSPIPMTGVPMSVVAAPFKGIAPNASIPIAVELRVDEFRFTEGNGTINGNADVTFVVTDREGKSRANSRHALGLTMKPDTLERAKQHGFRLVTATDLPPGRYQLRVAAGEEGGRSGSVVYDLEVPDFYKAPLTMSGIALTSASAGQTPTVLPKNPLADFLPAPMTTKREFSRNDEIALFVEFYENVPNAPPHNFDVTTTLRASDGRQIAQSTEQRSSTELQGKSGGYGFSTRLPLQNLEPGLYVIRVEGRSRLGGDRENTVGRDIQIRVN